MNEIDMPNSINYICIHCDTNIGLVREHAGHQKFTPNELLYVGTCGECTTTNQVLIPVTDKGAIQSEVCCDNCEQCYRFELLETTSTGDPVLESACPWCKHLNGENAIRVFCKKNSMQDPLAPFFQKYKNRHEGEIKHSYEQLFGLIAKSSQLGVDVDIHFDRDGGTVTSTLSWGFPVSPELVLFIAELGITNDDWTVTPGMIGIFDNSVFSKLHVELRYKEDLSPIELVYSFIEQSKSKGMIRDFIGRQSLDLLVFTDLIHDYTLKNSDLGGHLIGEIDWGLVGERYWAKWGYGV